MHGDILLLAADEGGGDPSPLTLINYGVLGVIFALTLTGWIWVKPAVQALVAERDRLIQERDECRAQRDLMAEQFQSKVIPMLAEFLAVTKVVIPALQDAARSRDNYNDGPNNGSGGRRGA